MPEKKEYFCQCMRGQYLDKSGLDKQFNKQFGKPETKPPKKTIKQLFKIKSK